MFALLVAHVSEAQLPLNSDFTPEIFQYDLSHLWTVDSFPTDDGNQLVERRESLGFIGDTYQRFQIHFTRVEPNAAIPGSYRVYGKTKVRDNVCDFRGTLEVEWVEPVPSTDLPEWVDTTRLRQFVLTGRYTFREHLDQSGAGILTGTFTTYAYRRHEGRLEYDGRRFVADDFRNHQFKGNWTSYRTGRTKVCNWSDYRIPDSGPLDVGAAEFGIARPYIGNGWENYLEAFHKYPPNDPRGEPARRRERFWWKE